MGEEGILCEPGSFLLLRGSERVVREKKIGRKKPKSCGVLQHSTGVVTIGRVNLTTSFCILQESAVDAN